MRSATLRLAGLALALGCSTSTLDALTHKPGTDGGAADSATSDGEGRGDRSVDQPPSCPTSEIGPGDTNETVQVGALTRSYFLHVPSSYDGTTRVPLLVDFHFLGNSGSQEMRVSPYPAVTDAEGVLIAFPDGLVGPGGTAWNVGPCCVTGDVDDVAFAKALVAKLQTKACIDPKRVFAVGYGLGGGISHHLGCRAADVFAAIAPVGFDLLQENAADCKPARPLTVVSIREVSDVFAPYDGGVFSMVPNMPMTLLGAEATFARWAEIDKCTGSPTVGDSNGCKTFQHCGGDVEVVLCAKQAGLPTLDNGSIAWPILKRHPMP